jgi:hypothetical protein
LAQFLESRSDPPVQAVPRAVHIHETAGAEAAVDRWAPGLELLRAVFQRPTIKKHAPSTKRLNTGSDCHGCLVVNVPQSREWYWRVEGLMPH